MTITKQDQQNISKLLAGMTIPEGLGVLVNPSKRIKTVLKLCDERVRGFGGYK